MSASQPSAAPLPQIYDLSPPHGAITENDHGAYVVISTWILMCFFTLCVIMRLLTRVIPTPVYGIDDIVIGLSLIFGIAQSAVVHIAASHGLGQHQDALSEGSFAIYAKNYYISNILFLITIYFAKISLVFFIMRLTPVRTTIHICYGLIAGITAWTIATTIALALQCNPPRPWDYIETAKHTCNVNIPALYASIGAIDILTDLAIVLMPVVIVWNVQISLHQRFTVIGVFACRLAVCVCSALRLSSLPAYFHSADKSWEAVTPQTWTQVVQCLSIITACIPCLRSFLASLQSGFMDSSVKGVLGTTYGAGSLQGSALENANGTRTRSFPLTSFAPGGRQGIVIPRIFTKSANVDVVADGSDREARSLSSFGKSANPGGYQNAHTQPGESSDSGEKHVDSTRSPRTLERTGSDTESTRPLTTASQEGSDKGVGIKVTREVVFSVERRRTPDANEELDSHVFMPWPAPQKRTKP